MTDDAILTTLGEGLDYTLEYEEGFSLAGATIAVVEYSHDVLAGMGAEITGERLARLTLPGDEARTLGIGKIASFRVEVTFPDGRNDVTPLIWIHVS